MSFVITLCFLVSGICFVLGLKMLGKTHSARKGNLVSAIGMFAATLGAFIAIFRDVPELGFTSFLGIILGILFGSVIGALAARLVKMTAMPEMVAIFNGFGGIASLLVAAAVITHQTGDMTMPLTHGGAATSFLAMLIGGVTFTGSIIAFLKLAEKMPTKPILYSGQNLVNGLVLLLIVAAGICYTIFPSQWWIFLVVALISLFLGVAVVIPIGGADMPVVISLLNSYSGLAACAAGFAVHNTLLILTGALVGASGIILTRIMCKAMNRSLANVLFSGFGSGDGGSTGGGKPGEQGTAKSMTAEDAYFILEAATSCVIVPGYGMAVAQAQHAVRELAEHLEHNGCEVRFAIHPVAGRMPGHMNVLLAEANVPYEQLVEMDDINPIMETQDVAIVIGANDVVNPAAREEEGSPIYGMPVINVDLARTVFVLKRSMSSGFAGIQNPLFFKDNTNMIFGDAKKTVEAMVSEFKED